MNNSHMNLRGGLSTYYSISANQIKDNEIIQGIKAKLKFLLELMFKISPKKIDPKATHGIYISTMYVSFKRT